MSNRKYKRVSILIVIFFVTLLLSIFKHYLKVDVHNCIDENTIVLRLAEIRSSDHPSTKGVNEFARLVRQR
ncbi:hypothetical protein Z968_01430 [Clostridium novyi A str. 4552]|uniref:Uncharacterized protein n=1 Tax=Clostridium novyi A str. 4552 TaxID=1444289 RepID=A0A0A0IAP5_CLONO|nr:hypothetical protein [Clostridium novyi]KGM98012.1 hypothetical protein Z968_01430 [Clostridium novyi A str. 4552]